MFTFPRLPKCPKTKRRRWRRSSGSRQRFWRRGSRRWREERLKEKRRRRRMRRRRRRQRPLKTRLPQPPSPCLPRCRTSLTMSTRVRMSGEEIQEWQWKCDAVNSISVHHVLSLKCLHCQQEMRAVNKRSILLHRNISYWAMVDPSTSTDASLYPSLSREGSALGAPHSNTAARHGRTVHERAH